MCVRTEFGRNNTKKTLFKRYKYKENMEGHDHHFLKGNGTKMKIYSLYNRTGSRFGSYLLYRRSDVGNVCSYNVSVWTRFSNARLFRS